ncbi:MAG: hypothetical protein RIS64_4319 [Bacteroidota bacterium]
MQSLKLSVQTLDLEEIKVENLSNIEGGSVFIGFGPWNAGANLAWRVGSIQANIASQNANSRGHYSNGHYTVTSIH